MVPLVLQCRDSVFDSFHTVDKSFAMSANSHTICTSSFIILTYRFGCSPTVGFVVSTPLLMLIMIVLGT